MKTLVFPVIFSLFCSMGFSNDHKEKPEWFTCEADKDCVDINYSCAGAVVNKTYLEEANKHYRYINSVTECYVKPPSKDQKTEPVPFKIFCKEKKCQKQGVNPKQGFS